MSDDEARVEAIRERAEAATPGPWRTEHVYGLVSPTQIDGYAFPERRAEDKDRIESDTSFVANAREDIPWLLERLRAAEAERDARAEDARLYNEDVSRAIRERNAAEARAAEAEAVIGKIETARQVAIGAGVDILMGRPVVEASAEMVLQEKLIDDALDAYRAGADHE